MPEYISRFSLLRYYAASKAASLLDAILILLLVLLLLLVPLPFGSILHTPLFALELTAAIGCLFWMMKLILCGNPDELKKFREVHRAEKEMYLRAPFFHRWPSLAGFGRILTLGHWPRKNIAEAVIADETESLTAIPRFYSFFGFPVRKTGLEPVALALLGCLFLQIIPFPHFFISLISPNTANLYESAAHAAGSEMAFHPFSLDAFLTFEKMMEYGAYFLIYVVVVNASPAHRYFRAILIALIASVAFQSTYGLFELLSGHQHIFTYEKRVFRDVASGTFINRNHFAAYLGLMIPVLLALGSGRLQRIVVADMDWRVRMVRYLEAEGSRNLLFLTLIALAVAGVFFSLSRSGILFAVVTSGVFLVLYRNMMRKLSRKSFWILTGIGVIAVVLWVGSGSLLHRFMKIPQEFVISERSRLQVNIDTFRIFLHFPLAGTGAGTFSEVFPTFRSFATGTIYTWAHNDYLQLFSEIGLTGIILIVSYFYLTVGRLKTLLMMSVTRTRVVQIGAFCGWLAMALNSLTNFASHIPAIAVTGVVMSGLFWGNSRAEKIL